jgi:hypothetical protein
MPLSIFIMPDKGLERSHLPTVSRETIERAIVHIDRSHFNLRFTSLIKMSSKMHTKPNRSSLSTPLEETAKKHSLELKQLEEMTSVEQSQDKAASVEPNLEYNENDEQPELQFRTYIALAAMFFMPLPVVSSLFGPPSVVCLLLLITTCHRFT